MAYALVAHIGQQSTNGNGFTTSSVDSTGSNLIVAVASSSDGTPAVTDSKSNTWVSRTLYGSTPKVVIWYAKNPTVGTGHTFTITATTKFPCLCVATFSGGDTVTAYERENGQTMTAASTVQPGSITPAEDNELIICSIGGDGAIAPPTIDSGYTISDGFIIVGGLAYGASLAYLIQTTAGATNPTWSWGGSNTGGSGIAAFKAAAAATGLPPGLGPDVGMQQPMITGMQTAMMR